MYKRIRKLTVEYLSAYLHQLTMRNSWTQMLKPERTHYFSLFRLLQNKFWLNRKNMQRTHETDGIAAILKNHWFQPLTTPCARPLLHLRETAAREDQRATNKLRARSKRLAQELFHVESPEGRAFRFSFEKYINQFSGLNFGPATLHRTFLVEFGAIKANDKESLVKPGEFGQFVLWQDSVQTKRTWYG